MNRNQHERNTPASFLQTRLSVIIVNFNTGHLLAEMFRTLYAAAGRFDLNCVLVDNASRDNSVALIRRDFPAVRLIASSANIGFGRANNLALQHVDGKYVLLLNTDAFVSHDTLETTVAYMDANPRCGILGVKLVDRDGQLQPSARYFPTPWNLFLKRTGLNRLFKGVRLVDDMAWDHASVRQCDWVPGCYYLIRMSLIDQVGLFDPRYFLYYEEVDHCLAAKQAGWEVIFYPHATVVHIGGESAKSEGPITENGRQLEPLQVESELLYFRKHYGVGSVFMNVLLTTLGDVITFAKRLSGRKSPLSWSAYGRHIALTWSLFRRTRWGTRPTR